MKKLLIVLAVLGICFSADAKEKFHPATVTFYDGGQFSGLAKFNRKQEVEFKISEEDEIEALDGYVIKRIIFHVAPYNVFEYIFYKNRYKLLQKIVEGKVSAYAQFDEPINDQITLDQYERATLNRIDIQGSPYDPLAEISPQQVLGTLLFSKKVRFFVKREADTTVEDLKLNFRKEAQEWFKDCPELAGYIKEKEWKYEDIKTIVEFYNEFCGEE
ncbi:hypothetical protein [Rasiella sp. SM2506]|uniref:hypothetical protein n=1 Tax=Rasiella sp. SM2506 TaxID=3423914 RepID=UPI003D7A5955